MSYKKSMKINEGDYYDLKLLFKSNITREEIDNHIDYLEYNNLPSSENRIIWDCYWKLIDDDDVPIDYDKLSYLDDSHIETAITNIFNEVFNNATN